MTGMPEVARAKERLAVYPGVFDPPTVAHLALIAAALGVFDRLAVVVAVNPSKPAPLFPPEERGALLRASVDGALPAGLSTRVDVRHVRARPGSTGGPDRPRDRPPACGAGLARALRYPFASGRAGARHVGHT